MECHLILKSIPEIPVPTHLKSDLEFARKYLAVAVDPFPILALTEPRLVVGLRYYILVVVLVLSLLVRMFLIRQLSARVSSRERAVAVTVRGCFFVQSVKSLGVIGLLP